MDVQGKLECASIIFSGKERERIVQLVLMESLTRVNHHRIILSLDEVLQDIQNSVWVFLEHVPMRL